MQYFVYLIISKKKNRLISYVGYTNNLAKRIKLHNEGKGAKYTRGKKWKIIYFVEYPNKSMALREEHKLKKNRKLRDFIKKINKKEVF